MAVRWFAPLFVIACSGPRPPTKPEPAAVAPIDAAGGEAVLEPAAGDPAEPVAPTMECQIVAQPVYCETGVATRTALQPSPFEWCARQRPASEAGAMGGSGRLFSAAQTRLARKTQPSACCYLEWTWVVCR